MNKCKLCNGNNVSLKYTGKIRNGSFGKSTSYDENVYKCHDCSILFLSNTTYINEFYESEEYRNSYNSTYDKKSFIAQVAGDNEQRLYKIGVINLVDKSVVDIGVGAGVFLDLISSFSKDTIAIEPAKFYHDELSKLHKVYSYTSDAINDGVNGDVVMSFNVIEHVENPLEFLQDKFDILNDGGTMYMVTPNHDDILMRTIPEEFSPFYYRTAHLYYFDKKSISYLLDKAGFKNYKVEYMHTMDMSNMMIWLKENKPSGLNKLHLFDDSFNDIYKNYLESKGMANYLWIEARK